MEIGDKWSNYRKVFAKKLILMSPVLELSMVMMLIFKIKQYLELFDLNLESNQYKK